VPPPRVSDLASLTFQGSALVTRLCGIQRLSFVCPFKSVSLHMEYCKRLLDWEAGMPFCLNDQNTNLGLVGTGVPLSALIKMQFGRLKGL